MKIILISCGSRRDGQPSVALARGLRAAGNEVHLAAPHCFADFSGQHGLPFILLAEAETDAIRNDAQAAGRLIRSEDGIGTAFRPIGQHAGACAALKADCS